MQILLPDILLLSAVMLMLIVDIVTGARSIKGQRVICAIAVLSSLASAAGYACGALSGQSYYFFSGMIVIDPFANILKAVVAASFSISLIYSRQYLEERDLAQNDFYLLALFSLLGQLVMICGHNMLTLYLGLELMSLSLYALIALRRDHAQALEAAVKYYVLGALASGFVLYGMSMLYGATGSLDIGEILRVIDAGQASHMILLFGTVFIVAGVAFKLGAAPFHMWAPDVYHGAPTAVTLLISAGPKVAAFAWGLRLLVTGLLPLATDWQHMLILLAVLSLIVGNLTGIVQKNIKRMLAYSAIAHMGFILLSLLSGVVIGKVIGTTAGQAYGAAMFYSIVYLMTTLGSFGVLLLLARRDFEITRLDDLKGLSQRHPMCALMMLVMMFSLAGIPPTAGFYAKFAVLSALAEANLIWLAVFAVLTSLFGAFYYLRIVKLMYFDAPTDFAPGPVRRGAQAVLIANGAAVLALGIAPGGLIALCVRAVTQIPL
jgi:NADH-quinone oxidoreductase subunit N